MNNLSLDFLNVTEEAAISALKWVGSGNKISADEAATTAMRNRLNNMNVNARVVIGEGELDEAPMLYIGEQLGKGDGPCMDIAVDPIEGTNLTVNGKNNAVTVIAAAPQGALLHAPDMYMEKIAVGPNAKRKINIDKPLIDNLHAIAKANNKKLSKLNVLIQHRNRHQEFIDIIHSVGAKVHLFDEGDVTYAIATCIEKTDIDLFIGTGGAPEGVVSAVALKCLGGEMQAKLLPMNEQEFSRCKQMGTQNPDDILYHEDLVKSEDCIFALTGITDNIFLNGIKSDGNSNLKTHSILINGHNKQYHFVESIYPINENKVVSV